MSVQRYDDASVADWLRTQDRTWYDLSARGPLGFESYARLRFIPDPSFDGQRENDAPTVDLDGPGPSEIWQIGVAVSHLTQHTSTPDELFYLVWEGWPDVSSVCDPLGTADVKLADERGFVVRRYYLLRGFDADLSGWDLYPETDTLESRLPLPAFIWPADRAWCVSRDTDPHFASIGASAAAIADILADARIDVVEDDPDTNPPRYH